MSAGGLVWPSYAAVEADGYGVTDDSDVDRTPFDDGLIRQERRYASALSALSITALLANDARLCGASAPGPPGAPTAGLPGPRRKAAAFHQVRVRGGSGGIEYTARIGGDGRRTWEAALTDRGRRSVRLFLIPQAPGARSARSCAPRAWTRDTTRYAREARSRKSGPASPVPLMAHIPASVRCLREH